MGYLQGNHKYDIILGRDTFSELQINLCSFNNIRRGDVGAYKGCTAPMKYMNNSTINTSSVRFHYKPFVTKNYGRENTQWTTHGVNV